MKVKRLLVFNIVILTILLCSVWISGVTSPKKLGKELTIIRLTQFFNVKAESFNNAVSVLKPNYFFQQTFYIFELDSDFINTFWENNTFRYVGYRTLEIDPSLKRYFIGFDLEWGEDYILYYGDYGAKLFLLNYNGLFFYIR
ncbi:MAG: hypothetical protein JJU05_07735 [Verrucomicrobia bacterium]|nr:hypothetical protein [Verrucomicrobiota bacterium]